MKAMRLSDSVRQLCWSRKTFLSRNLGEANCWSVLCGWCDADGAVVVSHHS